MAKPPPPLPAGGGTPGSAGLLPGLLTSQRRYCYRPPANDEPLHPNKKRRRQPSGIPLQEIKQTRGLIDARPIIFTLRLPSIGFRRTPPHDILAVCRWRTALRNQTRSPLRYTDTERVVLPIFWRNKNKQKKQINIDTNTRSNTTLQNILPMKMLMIFLEVVLGQ